jgi:hypothetical protein
MSLSSLMFLGICYGMYQLGAFNERHPGEVRRRTVHAWFWLCDWLKNAK